MELELWMDAEAAEVAGMQDGWTELEGPPQGTGHTGGGAVGGEHSTASGTERTAEQGGERSLEEEEEQLVQREWRADCNAAGIFLCVACRVVRMCPCLHVH